MKASKAALKRAHSKTRGVQERWSPSALEFVLAGVEGHHVAGAAEAVLLDHGVLECWRFSAALEARLGFED